MTGIDHAGAAAPTPPPPSDEPWASPGASVDPWTIPAESPVRPAPTTWIGGAAPPGPGVPFGSGAFPGYPTTPPVLGPGAIPGAPPAPPASPSGRRSGGGRGAIVAAVVAACLASVLTATLMVVLDGDDGGGRRAASELDGERLDIRALLDRAQPSVVSISTGQETTLGVFGGAGSGVIISDDGLVLTNAHVISGATEVEVTMHDGESRTATLVGSSPDDDIALVRLDDTSELVPAELGSSGDILVGDEVVAIGNALNLGGPPSVTRGIVSAKDRTITAPGDLVLRNLIQTDAAINPGNSGGPLLDAAGRVVGVNTAIIDDAQNIGFAIAIDPIKPLIETLASGDGPITPDSAFLGVSMMELSEVLESVLDEYGVTADDGAFVSDLVPGSAADESGIELGDVIVAIDGERVRSPQDAAEIILDHEAGDMITIEFERAGESDAVVATLRSRGDPGG